MADGKVVISTELDSKGAEQGTKNLASKLTSGFGSVVSSAAKIGTVAVAAGATATAALTKSALDSYASYEQLVGGVETLFKDSAGIVQGYAENAYKTADLSANAYMETVTSFSASLLQSVGGDTEKAAKIADQAIVDMSDNANKMGTSMEMIQNAYQGFAKQNYTMLDNLKLGYGGTKTEMERLLADAEKISGQKFNLDSYADVVQAIHVVQTEMGITGTTAKEASTTIEGSTQSMKAAWENLITGIARDDADVSKLIDEFVSSVETVGENIFPRVEQILDGIGTLISRLLPIIMDKVPSLLLKYVPKLVTAGYNLLIGIVNGFIQAAPEILSMIPIILEEIGTIIFETIPEFVNSIADYISNIDLSSFGSGFVQKIADGLQTGIPILVDTATNLIVSFVEFIGNNLPFIVQAGLDILLGLVNGLLSAIPNLLQALPTIIDSIVNGLLDSIPLIIDAGVQLLTSLVEDLPDIINTIVEVIPEIITNLIDSVISHIPQIAEAGMNLLISLVKNLPKILITLVKGVGQLIVGIVKAIVTHIPDIAKAGFDLLVSIFKNIPKLLGEAVVAVGRIIGFIVDSFANGMTRIFEIGKHIVEGIWEGISGAGGWLMDKISGFADDVVDGIAGFFGISSPSKVMRDRIGRFLAEGIWVGFDMYNPMDKINKELNYGMRSLETSMVINGANREVIDYQQMGEAVTDGFVNANIGVSVDGRQYGRLARGYA